MRKFKKPKKPNSACFDIPVPEDDHLWACRIDSGLDPQTLAIDLALFHKCVLMEDGLSLTRARDGWYEVLGSFRLVEERDRARSNWKQTVEQRGEEVFLGELENPDRHATWKPFAQPLPKMTADLIVLAISLDTEVQEFMRSMLAARQEKYPV